MCCSTVDKYIKMNPITLKRLQGSNLNHNVGERYRTVTCAKARKKKERVRSVCALYSGENRHKSKIGW